MSFSELFTWSDNGSLIYKVLFRVFYSRVFHFRAQVPRIGYDALERGRSDCFGRTQIDAVIFGAGASGEIAGHGPKADLAGSRRLSHANAAQTPGFVYSRPCPQEWNHPAPGCDILDYLPAAGVHIKRGPGGCMSALKNPGHHHQIPEGRIHAAPDDNLVHFQSSNFTHRDHISRRVRLGYERLDFGEVNFIIFVVFGRRRRR